MKTLVVTGLGCALLAFMLSTAPVVSTAQTTLTTETPTPVPVSYPNFASMKFLVGTWTCTQPWRGRTRTETDVYALRSDRMWLVDTVTSPPFDQYRTVPRNGTMLTTYDSTIDQWIAIYYDNLGTYAIESTSGWQGNVASWSGKGLDGRTFSDVITKVSDTQTSDTSTLTDSKGKTTNVTITCKKTG
jgi:hypothetical protein